MSQIQRLWRKKKSKKDLCFHFSRELSGAAEQRQEAELSVELCKKSPRKQLLTTPGESANKASCRTHHRDGAAYTLPLAHFTGTKQCCGYERTKNRRKKKACRHAEPPQKNTRECALAFCFDLNWAIVRLFLGKNNKTSLPFSRYTSAGFSSRHPSLLPFSPLLSSIGFLQAICSDAGGSAATPVLLDTPRDPAFFSGRPQPTPTWGMDTSSLAWLVSQGPGGCLSTGRGRGEGHTSVWCKHSRCAQWDYRVFPLRES